jgi:hypothetical protein
MSNPTSPNTPDFQMTFSRPQFSEEEIRKFFAPVLDDDEPRSGTGRAVVSTFCGREATSLIPVIHS